ncbi:MAG: transketolase C-terminal domain-containing protein [Chloroflexota bacterium]|jgi:pyruvate ferredoxin oxidoreductase alpha subunit
MITERKVVGLTGDGAAADAMMQINPDQVAAYPITPQTEIVERFAEYVANGDVQTEFVAVESEHSALSACCGGSAAGGRVMTCTSSQGLALMHEILYIAAGNRLPIVMPMVNRTLSAPINIHGDHSDSMGSRDCSWIQLFAADAQEVYDSTIMAIRIAEHPDVSLPVMVCFDGFNVSHDMERVEMLTNAEVQGFIGEFKPQINMLDPDNPISIGALALPPVFSEHKLSMIKALEGSVKVAESIFAEYAKLSGRPQNIVESFGMEDAEVALVALSGIGGTAQWTAMNLRKQGVKVGVVRPRIYRPFPTEQMVSLLKNCKAVAVVEKAASPGAPASPMFSDLSAAMYDLDKRPKMVNYVTGLGGRDTSSAQLTTVVKRLQEIASGAPIGDLVSYIGVRE